VADITIDFTGSSGTELSVYDSNFVAQYSTIELNGDGTASATASDMASYHYEGGQTGLDQSCTAYIKANELDVGSQKCVVCVHMDTGEWGLGLGITSDGTEIFNCSIVEVNTIGNGQNFIASVGNSNIAIGGTQFIEYAITVRDNGDGTVDIDAVVDGTPYADVVEDHTFSSAGYPGVSLWKLASEVTSMTFTGAPVTTSSFTYSGTR